MTSIDSFDVGSISYSTATLSWSGTFNKVQLYYSSDNSTYTSVTSTFYDTSYSLTGLTSNTLYYYKLIPYDSSGNSGTSETVFFTTSTYTVINSFWAGNSTSSMIPLNWQGTYYNVDVYYKKDTDTDYSLYTTVTGSPYVQITSLDADTSYNFYITPYNLYNTAGSSSSVITVATDYEPYIGNIYLGSVAATSVVLNWDGKYTFVTIQKSTDGVNYSTDIKLFEIDSSNSTYATDSSYSITTLYPYTTYYFKIIPYSANYNAGTTSSVVYTTTLMGIDLIESSGNVYNSSATIYWEGIYTRLLIYRMLDSTAIVVSDISNTSTDTTTGSYTYTGLSTYKDYYFYLQPYNGSTKTTVSDVLSVTTDFSAQVGLTTSYYDITTTSITVTFKASGYTSPYYYTALLQQSTDDSTYTDVSLVTQQTTLSSPTTYTVSNLSSNTLYYFRANPYSLYNVSGDQVTTYIATLGYIDSSNIGLSLDSSNQVVISCSGSFSTADIQYYYGSSDGTYSGTVSRVSYSSFPYTISGSLLSTEYPYYFYLVPYNVDDNSGSTSSYLYNPVITTFYISEVSDNYVTMYWSGNYDNVTIQKRDFSGTYYTDLCNNVTSSINEVNIAATPASTTTYFRVIPYDDSDVSGRITSEIFIPTIVDITMTNVSQYDISMTWSGAYSFVAVQYSTTSSTSGFTTLFDISTAQYDLSATNYLDISSSIMPDLDASSNTYYFRLVPYSYGTGIYGNTVVVNGLTSSSIYNSSIAYMSVTNPTSNPTYRAQVDFSGTFDYAQLYYRESGYSFPTTYTLLSSGTTTYTIGALKSNTKYYFRIKHYNDTGMEGVMHREMELTTTSIIDDISAGYYPLSCTSSSILLIWNNNSYYYYVDIYDSDSTFLSEISSTDNSFNTDGIQTTLSANTAYTYTLKFYDSFGNMESTTVTAYTSAATKDIQITQSSAGFIFTWDNSEYNTITIQNTSTMSDPVTYSSLDSAIYDSFNDETYNTSKSANNSLLPDTEYTYKITVTNDVGTATIYNITATTSSDYNINYYSMNDILAYNAEAEDLVLLSYDFSGVNTFSDKNIGGRGTDGGEGGMGITGSILYQMDIVDSIDSFSSDSSNMQQIKENFYYPPFNMYYYYPFNYDMNNYKLGYSVIDTITYNDINIDYVNGNTSKPRALVLKSDKNQFLELSPIQTTNGGGGMTLSFWFYPIDCDPSANIIDFMGIDANTNHLSVSVIDSYYLMVTYSNEKYKNSIQLPYKNNKWNHLLVVFNGNPYNKWEGYINGKKIITTNGICPVLNIGSKNYIGMNITSEIYYNGYIDDFRLYKNALSTAEIENLILRGAWKLFE